MGNEASLWRLHRIADHVRAGRYVFQAKEKENVTNHQYARLRAIAGLKPGFQIKNFRYGDLVPIAAVAAALDPSQYGEYRFPDHPITPPVYDKKPCFSDAPARTSFVYRHPWIAATIATVTAMACAAGVVYAMPMIGIAQ